MQATRDLPLRSSAQGTNSGQPKRMSTEPARLHDLDSELISRVTRGIEEIRAGKMLILVDDEDAKMRVTWCWRRARHAEAIAFMANHARGLICLTLTDEQIARLELPMMQAPGRSGPRLGTAFTVSIEASQASPPASAPPIARAPFKSPSIPTRNRTTWWCPVTCSRWWPGMAGCWCARGKPKAPSISRAGGFVGGRYRVRDRQRRRSMARMPDLERFAKKHGLVILTIADLIAYRLQTEALVSLVAESQVELDRTHTTWRACVFEAVHEGKQFWRS